MNNRIHTPGVLFGLLAMLAFPSASSAQVKVIISGGFTAAYRELLPEFEQLLAVQ